MKVTLVEQDGVVTVQYETFIVRFLFSDGTTADVVTHLDSSTLRQAALEYFHKERIEGTAVIPLATAPAEPSTKRRVRK